MNLDFFRTRALLLAWWTGLYLPPDRRVLERTILAHLAEPGRYRRVLFAGVRFYTRKYPRPFRQTEFVTLDYNPAMARHGATRHVVDRLEAIDRHFPAGHFDAIVVNGVIGWGLDSREGVETALRGCARCLAEGGLLVLGLNELHAATPKLDGLAVWSLFEPVEFPPLGKTRLVVQTPFDEREHTFLFFRKRTPAPSAAALTC